MLKLPPYDQRGIVEIHDLHHTLRPQRTSRSPSNLEELVAIDFNGRRGQVVRDIGNEKCLVHTFEEHLVVVPKENLRPWDPESAEDGGFDTLWPLTPEEFSNFAGTVTSILADKGWCMVQMNTSDARRAAVTQQLQTFPKFTVPPKEFVRDYMGRGGTGKLATLEDMLDEDELPPPLSDCCAQLNDLIVHLGSMSEDTLGFRCFSRSRHQAWVPYADDQEEIRMRPKELDFDDVDSGLLEEHLIFIQRRRLCLMYFVDNDESGEICLYPQDHFGRQTIKMPVTRGKLLLFRHDQMSFSVKQRGKSVVLQTWILDGPPDLAYTSVSADYETRMEAIGINYGMGQPLGERVHVMSIMARLPGGATGGRKYCSSLLAGTDSLKKIPRTRFDVEMYYSEVDEDHFPGKSMTKHGGFCGDKDVYTFDKDFFNLSQEQVLQMAPCQRVLLEVGYQCLSLSGHTKASCRSLKCGVYVGDCGSDVWPGWNMDMTSTNPFAREGTSNFTTASRLSHCLGLTGPVSSIDTACSSSLVAATLAFNTLWKSKSPEATEEGMEFDLANVKEALPIGITVIISPYFYVNLSLAQMFSPTGRCFTFAHTANGYARGEGCGVAHLRGSDSTNDVNAQLACLMGSTTNQDGKSATLTAPNGPSQTACINSSLELGDLAPEDITLAECHGTGTALGDPIEVGAFRAVVDKKRLDETRHSVLMTSAKCCIGHLEAGAGMAGLQKCIISLMSSIGTPNVHLYQLNPHLDVNGFPVYFETEVADTQLNSGVGGVSSFGFGGTNARGDVWVQCRIGPHSTSELDIEKVDAVHVTCPITLGPIDWLTGEPARPSEGKRQMADVLRDEFASYDISAYAYTGGYRYRSHKLPELEHEGTFKSKTPICISGSWNGRQLWEEMEDEGGGWYSYIIVLGESRFETFSLCIDADETLSIYPAIDNASQNICIFGPDDDCNHRNWIIDGRDNEIPANTIFKISFRWGTERKGIFWEKQASTLSGYSSLQQHPHHDFTHVYAVVGSWTSWLFSDMIPHNEEECTWTCNVKIGSTGKEEFQFARDRDWKQIIYPAKPRTAETSVPVRGPDDMGHGKNWIIFGERGEVVNIKLTIVDARINLLVTSDRRQPTMWESVSGWSRHEYFLAGSSTDWNCVPMVMDPAFPGVFKVQSKLPMSYNGPSGFEARFRILVDEDFRYAFHPQKADAGSGESIVSYPDAKGPHDNFLVASSYAVGAAFEVTLDLTAIDTRKRVTWKFVDVP